MFQSESLYAWTIICISISIRTHCVFDLIITLWWINVRWNNQSYYCHSHTQSSGLFDYFWGFQQICDCNSLSWCDLDYSVCNKKYHWYVYFHDLDMLLKLIKCKVILQIMVEVAISATITHEYASAGQLEYIGAL